MTPFFLPFWLEASARATLVLAAAMAANFCLRQASASLRHAVWVAAVVAALILPLLSAALPSWPILSVGPVDASRARPVSDQLPFKPAGGTAAEGGATTGDSIALPPSRSRPSLGPARWMGILWAIGCGFLLVRLVVAQWTLHRAFAAGEPPPARLIGTTTAVAQQLGIERSIAMRLGARGVVSMVFGVFRARLLLPAGAAEWSEAQLRSVLWHELAHVRRHDPVIQGLVQLARALHWFNPLIWLATWRLQVECERACDDVVLAHGVRASDYAEHLLRVVLDASAPDRGRVCGVAIVGASSLAQRVRAVLDPQMQRRGLTRPMAICVLATTVALAIPVAMLSEADEKGVLPGAPASNRSAVGFASQSQSNVWSVTLRPPRTDRTTLVAVAPGISNQEDSAPASAGGSVRLKLAERELARLFKLQRESMGSLGLLDEQLDQARMTVEVIRAEEKGNVAEADRARIRYADRQLERLTHRQREDLEEALRRTAGTQMYYFNSPEMENLRLRHAEWVLEHVKKLHRKGFVSDVALEQARSAVETLKR